MTDAERLRQIHEASGLTDEALAAAIGVDVKTLYNWTHGKPIPAVRRAWIRRVTRIKRTRRAVHILLTPE